MRPPDYALRVGAGCSTLANARIMSKRRRAGNDFTYDTLTMSIGARSKGNAGVRIRVDVVEAMKRKLAAGEIGNNSFRLADRLIDILIQR